MSKSNKNVASEQDLVTFGKNIVISTKKRLPQFDNGPALAYEAHNPKNKSKKFIAIVSGMENLPRYNFVANYKNLTSVSFLNLVSSGAAFWPPENSQKFIIIYDRNIDKPILEEGAISNVNWRHPEIISLFIEPMVTMIREMRDKGFCHGSIRPSNIFFPYGSEKMPVILGDGLSAQPSSTQPSLFLPINKALADPMGRGQGSVEDDVYAFGVTLLLFLRKNDELSVFDDEEILRRKVEFGSYSTLIGKERFQESFLELLRGVLYDDEEKRWSVDDIFSWLDGVRITPLTLGQKKKANRPFSFNGKKYLYAELLAVDLYKNTEELADLIDDGSLDRWLRKSLDDTALLERYEKAVDAVSSVGSMSDNIDYSVFHLGIALNPALPAHYKGKSFTYDGVGALLFRDACEGKDLNVFKEVLKLNILDYALVSENLNQAIMMNIFKQYDTCRAALSGNKMEQGIERCIYTLCPSAPCLSPKLKGYFVYSGGSLLSTLEALCKKGGQVSLMVDNHIAAFFAVRNSSFMSSYLIDFNSVEKNNKILGNLHFMAALQRQSSIKSLPAIASVLIESLSDVYKIYKNVGTRTKTEESVKAAAKEGDLITMSSLVDNPDELLRDEKGFSIAKAEYKLLQNEYSQYNSKLANKKTYGLSNGHDIASSISWLASTIITVIVVLAFMSGNQIF
ncbi:MAG: hypothetical protein ACRBB3_08325 [Alphaproteobacteria bacterium]